jgi:ferric-dicitrate binding protein FerR (iron transport regulator)
MSRSPEEIKNWENVLREGSFDLPEAIWQRMENDMRGFLAAQAREASKPRPLTFAQRLKGWLVLPTVRWGIGAAALSLIAISFVTRTVENSKATDFAWVPGQALETNGVAEWNWLEGRSRIQGTNSRLLLRQASNGAVEIDLERGQATFQVDHRKPEESFSVKVGDCNVHVVGTTFTVGIDSLKQWVSVEEGKIRFESRSGQRMVAKGQSSTCSEVVGSGAHAASVDTTKIDTPARPLVPVAATSSPAAAKSARAPEVRVPSCTAGDECIAELSEFVRSHGAHPAAGEIALRWARLASRKGDHRDALVAYGFASEHPSIATIAKLEMFQTRLRGLGQLSGMNDSLDRWIPQLQIGSGIWREAMALRKDVARRQGDGETVKRIDANLQSAARAESGGR